MTSKADNAHNKNTRRKLQPKKPSNDDASSERDSGMNKSGQTLGQKGLNTRARIIMAAERLLTQSRGVAPLAAALAREAGVAPASFYLYFTDVGEVVLALVEQLNERFQPVVALSKSPWDELATPAYARRFVQSYFDFWSVNASVLRARNRLADEGDQRFLALRMAANDPLVAGLADKISTQRYREQLPCTTETLASMIITALERSATVLTLDLYPIRRSDPDLWEAINALAIMISSIIPASRIEDVEGGTDAPPGTKRDRAVPTRHRNTKKGPAK